MTFNGSVLPAPDVGIVCDKVMERLLFLSYGSVAYD